MDGDFYTLESLLTFAGATGATALIWRALEYAFPSAKRPWLGLLVAQIISLGGVLLTLEGDGTMTIVRAIFVAIVNGFLVFATVAGLPAVKGLLGKRP